MFLSNGVETRRAAVNTAAVGRSGGRAVNSLKVTQAPIVVASQRRSSGIPINEITVFGSWCRRFMLGYRSVPPATNMASGPASAFIFRASAMVLGWRYRKNGSRSIRAPYAAAPAPSRLSYLSLRAKPIPRTASASFTNSAR